MGCDSPLGLVVAAARGRQHPAARVAPLQTLMGCSPVVAAAQPVLYSNLTIRRPMSTGAVSNYGKQQRHYKDKYNRLYALIGNLKGKTNLVLLNGKWHPDLRIVNSIQNT
jgi:hypothetical protein